MRPRKNGRHFPDDTFKSIFWNENVRISIEISLKFAPNGPLNKIPALVQIMAWRRPGDKLLSEPMMVRLLTHLCVTRPQWVNALRPERIVDILQTTFSHAFFWMKIYVFWLNVTEIGFLMSKWSARCWTVDSNKKVIDKYYNNNPGWSLFKIACIDLK